MTSAGSSLPRPQSAEVGSAPQTVQEILNAAIPFDGQNIQGLAVYQPPALSMIYEERFAERFESLREELRAHVQAELQASRQLQREEAEASRQQQRDEAEASRQQQREEAEAYRQQQKDDVEVSRRQQRSEFLGKLSSLRNDAIGQSAQLNAETQQLVLRTVQNAERKAGEQIVSLQENAALTREVVKDLRMELESKVDLLNERVSVLESSRESSAKSFHEFQGRIDALQEEIRVLRRASRDAVEAEAELSRGSSVQKSVQGLLDNTDNLLVSALEPSTSKGTQAPSASKGLTVDPPKPEGPDRLLDLRVFGKPSAWQPNTAIRPYPDLYSDNPSYPEVLGLRRTEVIAVLEKSVDSGKSETGKALSAAFEKYADMQGRLTKEMADYGTSRRYFLQAKRDAKKSTFQLESLKRDPGALGASPPTIPALKELRNEAVLEKKRLRKQILAQEDVIFESSRQSLEALKELSAAVDKHLSTEEAVLPHPGLRAFLRHKVEEAREAKRALRQGEQPISSNLYNSLKLEEVSCQREAKFKDRRNPEEAHVLREQANKLRRESRAVVKDRPDTFPTISGEAPANLSQEIFVFKDSFDESQFLDERDQLVDRLFDHYLRSPGFYDKIELVDRKAMTQALAEKNIADVSELVAVPERPATIERGLGEMISLRSVRNLVTETAYRAVTPSEWLGLARDTGAGYAGKELFSKVLSWASRVFVRSKKVDPAEAPVPLPTTTIQVAARVSVAKENLTSSYFHVDGSLRAVRTPQRENFSLVREGAKGPEGISWDFVEPRKGVPLQLVSKISSLEPVVEEVGPSEAAYWFPRSFFPSVTPAEREKGVDYLQVVKEAETPQIPRLSRMVTTSREGGMPVTSVTPWGLAATAILYGALLGVVLGLGQVVLTRFVRAARGLWGRPDNPGKPAAPEIPDLRFLFPGFPLVDFISKGFTLAPGWPKIGWFSAGAGSLSSLIAAWQTRKLVGEIFSGIHLTLTGLSFLAWSPLGIVAALSISSFGLSQLGILQVFSGLRRKEVPAFELALASTSGEVAGVLLLFHLAYTCFYALINVLAIPAPMVMVSGNVDGSTIFYRKDEGPDRPVASVDYKTRAAFVLLLAMILWFLGANTTMKKAVLEPVLQKCGNQAFAVINAFNLLSLLLLATNYVPIGVLYSKVLESLKIPNLLGIGPLVGTGALFQILKQIFGKITK
jgi:hypothetical protein